MRLGNLELRIGKDPVPLNGESCSICAVHLYDSSIGAKAVDDSILEGNRAYLKKLTLPQRILAYRFLLNKATGYRLKNKEENSEEIAQHVLNAADYFLKSFISIEGTRKN